MDYGLIGESLSRNFSKTIHELSGLYTYELYEPAPCRADSFIRQHVQSTPSSTGTEDSAASTPIIRE